jgi:serine/threonine-protein kinase
MYEMLTGRLPFEAASASELSQLHRTAQPPAPRQWNSDISPEMEAVILKVLSKEPSSRYRNADQFGRVLMSANSTPPPSSLSATAPDRRAWLNQAPPGLSKPMDASPTPPQVSSVAKSNTPDTSPLDIDWATWALTLLALIAVGGLIPLWLWVYFLYFPAAP